MAIVRWDPFGEMLRMQREADRIFSRMGTGQQQGGQGQEPWMPRIDIKQMGDDMHVRAELPGMKPEDVDIEVTNGVLTIKGESKQEEEREDEGWLVRESHRGSFMRSVALPETVDANSITADFHDGVLEMHVPKAFQQQQPQSTKIAIGGQQGQQKSMGGKYGSEQEMAGQAPRESTQEPTEGGREAEQRQPVGAKQG